MFHVFIYTCTHVYVHNWYGHSKESAWGCVLCLILSVLCAILRYGVALVSRIDKIIGLFCKRALQMRQYSGKETYNFIDPTDRSHPISVLCAILRYLVYMYICICLYMYIHIYAFQGVWLGACLMHDTHTYMYIHTYTCIATPGTGCQSSVTGSMTYTRHPYAHTYVRTHIYIHTYI